MPKINFEKLNIKVAKSLRQDYVGDWYPKKKRIVVHRGLKGIDRTGVIVHEFIEMVATLVMGIPECESPKYRQGRHGMKNELAHRIANKMEKTIIELGGYSWSAHQKRCRRLRNKIVRKKISKRVRFEI